MTSFYIWVLVGDCRVVPRFSPRSSPIMVEALPSTHYNNSHQSPIPTTTTCPAIHMTTTPIITTDRPKTITTHLSALNYTPPASESITSLPQRKHGINMVCTTTSLAILPCCVNAAPLWFFSLFPLSLSPPTLPFHTSSSTIISAPHGVHSLCTIPIQPPQNNAIHSRLDEQE